MKILAIDGNSILNRAFYGIRPLTSKDGTPTNAIFGFLNILLKLNKDFDNPNTLVTFDVSRKTFRNDLYSEYKANRKGMPDDLRVQLPIMKEILEYMGITVLCAEGFEGDDVLGTVSRICDEKDIDCIIATGDRDCLQLVSDNTCVALQKNTGSIVYNRDKVFEDFSIYPEQVTDLKGLMGDSSDNIPGVKGIGEKSAINLLTEYTDIENLYEHLDEMQDKKRVYNLLKDGKDIAFLSKELATISKNAPINEDIENLKQSEQDNEKLGEILGRLNLFSFFQKLGISKTQPKKEEPKQLSLFRNTEETAKKDNDTFSQGTDNCCNYKENIELSEKLALNIIGNKIYLAKNNDVTIKSINELPDVLKGNPEIITFDSKKVYKICFELNTPAPNIIFDISLAGYLLNPSAKSYDAEILNIEYLGNIEITLNGCNENDETIQKNLKEIYLTYCLYYKLLNELEKDNMIKLYNEIEIPLAEVLASMEHIGIQVDKNGIIAFGDQIKSEIKLCEQEIYRLAGSEFNINSTKELGKVLFEDLGLPAKKKTKSGYSTNVDVLESLMDKHEIIPIIMNYRKLKKLDSTYVVGLLKAIDKTGRIHSTFNQTETRTGRISSSDPNLQNIPVRTELGSEMRKFFTAKDGYVLIDADYSQIELRILADIADDKNMIDAFNNGADIHSATASQVFGIDKDHVDHEFRRRAKAINFGIVYGIGAHSLSEDIGVSYGEAKAYIDAYLKTYSGVKQYMEDIVKSATETGYVETIYGRRRRLEGIHSTNKMEQAFAKRTAFNTPVQGTAADIIKLAMIKVYKRLKTEIKDANLILQIHDELIVEVLDKDKDQAMKIVEEEMENAAKLKVKLLADVHSGNNWYNAKG